MNEKVENAIIRLTDMLTWSDRLGSDELIEIRTVIQILQGK